MGMKGPRPCETPFRRGLRNDRQSPIDLHGIEGDHLDEKFLRYFHANGGFPGGGGTSDDQQRLFQGKILEIRLFNWKALGPCE